MKKRILLVLAITVVLALLFFDAICIEPYRLQVEEVSIAFPDLPRSLDGLRIAQISDTHIRTLRPYEKRVLTQLEGLQPDLIAITGDLVEHTTSYEIWAERVEQVGKFLEELPPAPYGIWVTRGNTDISRYGGHSDLLVKRIRRSSANLLINAHAKLNIGGESFYLAGTDYAHLPKGFAADYVTVSESGNMVLAAGPCEGNSFTHYIPEDELPQEGYEFSGRLRYTDPAGGIGVLLGSRFPWGEDHFYRLRRYESEPEWRFSPRGLGTIASEISAEIQPLPGLWYHFRVRMEKADDQTRIKARLWQDGTPEPADWPINCISAEKTEDSSVRETVGLWSVGPGWKYFDDLEIRSLDGKSLHWRDDFESYPAGVNPPHWLDFGFNAGNLEEALRGVPEDAFTILLAHSPDIIQETAAAHVDLVLSGHTHGGQVRVPIIGPLYINTNLGRDYNQGLFRFNDAWLYVNRGIGTRALPIRFLCPPEITLLTLRRG